MLGVVENMSGLRMPAATLHFTAPDSDGGERDVSDAVRAALAGFPGLTASADVFAPTRGGAERVRALGTVWYMDKHCAAARKQAIWNA